MAQSVNKKVCVVGAGAAGLCAARHLAGDTNIETTVFEQTGDIGGTWVYNDRIGLNENGLPIHSSMYQNLRTNLPAKIMNFPDYIRMDAQEPCCISHNEILSYLHNYTEHFQLRRYIQFYVKVENIRPIKLDNSNEEKWLVRVKHLSTQRTEEHKFDAVMICNGHYFEPYMPTIKGMDTFPGIVMHSHSYRKPEEFKDKIILILGAASSGIDIAIDLTDYSSTVYLSHNQERFTSVFPPNMIQVVGVDRLEGTKCFLKDGTSVNIDVFLYCTGYQYSFPFLDESCDVRVDDNYVTPLYKHLINIEHQTMAIIGIPSQIVPFPMFHIQIQYFLSLLKNRLVLPLKSQMLEDSKLKASKKRHAHKMMTEQWEYNDSLADAGGFDRLPPFYKAGYVAWHSQRKANLLRYKYAKFVISEDGKNVELILSN
ncbi:flavin-containing monooxygenase FMO GS-OX-like 2 [Vespula squamosa]|uniref:Flavin-containing monooxygenase n=1 Tax=Vespula squamosa TaxID=30214 RepID=A0ABD1ZX69_VESSQ